jgi:hypothetical protein
VAGEPVVEAFHLTLTGLTGVDLGGKTEIALADEFFLSRRTPQLAEILENPFWMSATEKSGMKSVDCFFCLKSREAKPTDDEANRFQNAVMALQVVKPVPSIGYIFQGWTFGNGQLTVNHAERRPPMFAGEWSRRRRFDLELINHSKMLLPRMLKRMEAGSAEQKNSVILLQLALEHLHPLVKGLFAVMGLDALFNSQGGSDFKRKLCQRLGESTQVFPDWMSPGAPPPNYTVGEVAHRIYELRNKIAHGVDLRKAAQVDLTKRVELNEQLEPRSYAALLSEAAVYLLCLVLQRELGSS